MDAPETVVQPALNAAPKAELRPSPEGLECLSRLARTYVWWKTPEEAMRFPERVRQVLVTEARTVQKILVFAKASPRLSALD